MLRGKSPVYSKTTYKKQLIPSTKKAIEKLFDIMSHLYFKKKRFVFQILKQFYLFEEASSSSITSLSTYDKLIFSDQAIHTLVKKLETKVLERKIWAFINLKVLRIIQQVKKMTVKVDRVVKQKQVEFKDLGFTRIKVFAYNFSPIQSKNVIQQSRSQQYINSYTRVKSIQNSTTIISHISHASSNRIPSQIHVHRGSSRNRDVSPNSSQVRILTQSESRRHIQTIRISPGKVKLHDVSPRRSIQVIQRSPRKYDYEVDQIRRQYGDCYRIPSRIRVVSCGCRDITVRTCNCSNYISRNCGCVNCNHTCNGCNRCNCCHSHCCCSRSCSRSCSREQNRHNSGVRIKQTILLKNPQKQTKNRYLDHLQGPITPIKLRQNISQSPTSIRYQYSQTSTSQIRRI